MELAADGGAVEEYFWRIPGTVALRSTTECSDVQLGRGI